MLTSEYCCFYVPFAQNLKWVHDMEVMLKSSGIYKAPVDPAAPGVKNTKIYCRSFPIGPCSSDRRECSIFMLWDLE